MDKTDLGEENDVNDKGVERNSFRYGWRQRKQIHSINTIPKKEDNLLWCFD